MCVKANHRYCIDQCRQKQAQLSIFIYICICIASTFVFVFVFLTVQAYSVSSTSFQQSDLDPLGSALYRVESYFWTRIASREKYVDFSKHTTMSSKSNQFEEFQKSLWPALVLTKLLHGSRLNQHSINWDRLLLVSEYFWPFSKCFLLSILTSHQYIYPNICLKKPNELEIWV